MLSILVVDDEVDFRDLLSTYLTDNTENDVITAPNAREALEILAVHRRQKRPIDFIISDVYMPGIDGRKFYEEVRTLDGYEHVPFLFVSGFDDNYAKESVVEPYIEGFMRKSETPLKLLSWIEYLSAPLRSRTHLVRPAE